LAGSGGSYGFPEISAKSRSTEHWIVANPSPDSAGLGFLKESIGQIAAAFDEAAAALGLAEAPPTQAAFGWRAVVVGDDPSLVERAGSALADAQYTVERRNLEADPTGIPVSERPDLAVLVPSSQDALRTVVSRWARTGPNRPGQVLLVAAGPVADPLVEPVSSVDQVIAPDRIETVQAAARAWGRWATAPRTVLIVDSDDQGAVKTLTTALEGAAVKVNQVGGGLAARAALLREPPDLIVMEWRLADTTAAALLRWIRQQASLQLVPAVVFTAAADDATRLAALRAGADDVVVKTTPENHLAQIVLARIDRSRRIRTTAHRDDLTGLLNAAAMIEEIDQAIGLARRVGEAVAVLAIDLDHFRRINEQCGSAAGDLVLIHAARVIAGSVRTSDPVGRMGGEEFAVLLRRCRPDDARRIAEKIRSGVSGAPVALGEGSVTVRVSLGLAGYPDHGNSGKEVLGAAERALGQAKQTGRDRVVAA
jgi:diguanylate cyclase (GGDEF)-like protein